MVLRDAKKHANVMRGCLWSQPRRSTIDFVFYLIYFFSFVQSIKKSPLGDAINQMTSNRLPTVLYMRLSSHPFVTSADTRPFIKQMEDTARPGEMAVMSNRADR